MVVVGVGEGVVCLVFFVWFVWFWEGVCCVCCVLGGGVLCVWFWFCWELLLLLLLLLWGVFAWVFVGGGELRSKGRVS